MRLFVAIELDEEVRRKLRRVQEQLSRRCPGVRWVSPAQWHVTLKFLGEVAPEDVEDVANGVAQSAKTMSPFTLTFSEVGCFPHRGLVRVVWAGVREPSGALPHCAEAVEKELEDIGYERERRPFSPHLTLGRVREDVSRGTLRARVDAFSFEEVPQQVTAVTLMSSVLSPKGARYTAVRKVEMGQDDDVSREKQP